MKNYINYKKALSTKVHLCACSVTYQGKTVFEDYIDGDFSRLPRKKRAPWQPYNRNENGELTRIDWNYRPEAKFESGGGGLLSMLGDHSRFPHMLQTAASLILSKYSEEKIELMSTNHLQPEV